MEKNKDAGIRILSLDAGGPGTFSQLLIIKEYMTRLANDIGVDESDIYAADYFELMGGVGFGGLVSILLGRLRMNADAAIDALISLASAVFPLNDNEIVNQEVNTSKLKAALENLLQVNGIPPDTKMYDKAQQAGNCKVVIIAASSTDLAHPIFFRTYTTRGTSLNPTILEAICATMAIPALFIPINIGPHLREQNFVGGATGANNPTRELLKEALNIFGRDRRVAQVLSIGSGASRLMTLNPSPDVENINRLMQDLASDCGMVAKELSIRLFSVDAYLRINVEKGMENLKMQDWTCLGEIETHTTTYVETPAVTDAIDRSLRRLRERIGLATIGQINLSSSIKAVAKSAPAVSPCYTVRTREWGHMIRNLTEQTTKRRRVFPITGMGGCGKTQMVSYFLQEKGDMFTKVVFIDASSEDSIKSDLHTWARSLEDCHTTTVWDDALRILERQPPDQPWILILDNADDPALQLLQFFPKSSHGTIIITSRNRDVGYLSNTYHLEIGPMEREEALATLLKASQRQPPLSIEEISSINVLMGELGCLAVALVQAGTYCHQLSSIIHGVFQPYSFTSYLALFHSQRSLLMKRLGPSTLDGYGRGVYTTLDLSYNAIPASSRELLHLISYFHHSDIPLSMLATAAKTSFEDAQICLKRPEGHKVILSLLSSLLCPEKEWNELHMHEMIQSLRLFSLVSTSNVDNSIFLQLHPLVQAWARDKVSSTTQDYYKMAVQTITACCSLANNWLYFRLHPHINEILGSNASIYLHANDKMAFAMIFVLQGHYSRAESLFSQVLQLVKDSTERVEGDELWIITWLAYAIQWQGRWSEAEQLELGVLEQNTSIFGRQHPRTIAATAMLANTYHTQGRWSEAEKLMLDVLEQQRVLFGNQHPDIIVSVAMLSASYYTQGRREEAEKLGLDVLEQWRTILGNQHIDIMSTISNITSVYRAQGRWDEAEQVGLEILEQWRGTLGNQHPDTISATADLATTYQVQGRWSEAEKLMLDVLEQRRELLGSQHPDTVESADALSDAYYAQGQWDEAEKLGLEVLEQRTAILGSQHPNTIKAFAALAGIYDKQGRQDEAEAMKVEVLELRRSILGIEHPETILASVALASVYHEQGKVEDAISLLAPAVDYSLKVMGQRHLDTQNNIQMLLNICEELEQWEKARELAKLLV